MIKKLFILLVVLVLTGCGTIKEQVAVTETKNVLIVPDDELLNKCAVEAPPLADVYSTATWEQKEDMLIKHSGNQMKNIFKCNEQIKALNVWKKKQLALYPTAVNK